MIKKQFGKTSLHVSELCLGTMYFGTTIDKKNAFEVLDAFVDRGGNFIDTANNYCYWNGKGIGDESELLLSEWFKSRNNRSEIVLASKIGARPELPEMTNPMDPNFKLEGLRKETIIQAVDDSLKRLGTDYLDLCYIHADLEQYPLEERLEALHQLEQSGKIRFNGCSNIKTNRIDASEKLSTSKNQKGYQAIQQKYSYLLPTDIDPNHVLKFVDDEMIAYAEENGMNILTYSALLSGAYSRSYDELPENYKSDENKAKFDKMLADSKEMGCTPSQFVFLWLKAKSPQIIPLIAASRLSQLEENVQSLEFKLP